MTTTIHFLVNRYQHRCGTTGALVPVCVRAATVQRGGRGLWGRHGSEALDSKRPTTGQS
jgi:hypothetical protein